MTRSSPRKSVFDNGVIVRESQEMQFFCENEYKRKVCGKFIPDKKFSRRCVGCQYRKSEHVRVDKLDPWLVDSKKWRSDLHLQYVPGMSFHKIMLMDELDSLEKEAQIAIVANDTHPRLLVDILMKRWKLIHPNYVIAVSGSQRNLYITPKQNGRFKQELCKAVSSTKCWIMSGGTLSGIDNLVANALKELQYREWLNAEEEGASFQLFGMVNFNCIDLVTQMNKWYASHDESETLMYKIKHGSSSSKHPSAPDDFFMTALNPIYSHFLCLEGGTRGVPFQELEGRNEFLSFVAKPFDEFTIPVVLVVVGGELETLKEVATALADEVPVILCEGTGGAADIICQALRLAERQENNRLSPEQETFLAEQVESVLVDPKRKGTLFATDQFEAAVELHYLQQCILNIRNATVYKIDQSSAMPLDQCILKALLNGKTARTKDPVELALTWNRCDDVIREILQSEGGDINKRPNMDNLMTRAILEDKIDFIALFIEFGFEFAKFLTPRKLAHIYKESISESNSLLMEMLQEYGSNSSKFNLKDVYHIVYRFSSSKPRRVLLELSDGEGTIKVFQDPFRELFIWAVLTDRMEASEFFWKYCKNAVSMALIGSVLWRALTNVVHSVDQNRMDEMFENANTYLQFAQETLETCWNVNKFLAHETLEARPWSLGGKSLLDIAGFIEAKDFIAHPCCQVTLEHQWKGGLRCRLSHVLLSLICPLYLNFISTAQNLLPDAPADLWDEDTPPALARRNSLNEEDVDGDDFSIGSASSQAKRKELDTTTKEHDESLDVSHSKTKSGKGGIEGELGTNPHDAIETQDSADAAAEVEVLIPSVSLIDKMAIFYGVPVTKFLVHLISYVSFLILFSMYFLFYRPTDGKGNTGQRIYEWALASIWFSYYVDMVQNLVTLDASWAMKLRLWLQSEWSLLDFCYLHLALVSFALNGVFPDYVKGLYGIVCFLMWFRLLRFYSCSPKLGPMWIMIRKMLVELVMFTSVLNCFLWGTGIFLKVMMNVYEYEDPYSGPVMSLSNWKWLFLRPFFMFNGELFLDSLDEYSGDSDNFFVNYLWSTLMVMFFGNALMLNLLIAIFGTIYSEVEAISDREWKNEMFVLVREYQNKPHFPPPLSLIESCYKLYHFFSEKRRSRNGSATAGATNGGSTSDNSGGGDGEKGKSKLTHIFETYCVWQNIKAKETRLTPDQQLINTIRCVDNQHSLLFDMELLISEMGRSVKKIVHRSHKSK